LANQYPYNPDKAQQLLASIGLKKNASGQLIGKDGKPVTFNFAVPTGFTDWIQSYKVISDDLAKLGITLHLQTPSQEAWYNQLQTGSFDMSLTYGLNAFDPWFYYYSVLSSDNSAPIGKPASSNFERWSDPTTDQLLKQYQSLTDLNQRKDVIHKLEKIMIDQVPLIPLFYNANWNQYSTKDFVGWPDANNPYATPSFTFPDNEVIMTHLQLAH
jgi:peptide/nickel transport system substrate-binding protein